jgi:hypothetical protein
MKMKWIAVSAMALGGLLIAGCDDEDEDELVGADYDYVGDEGAWADTCAAVNYAMADPIGGFDCFSIENASTAAQGLPTTNDMAARTAARVPGYFSPAGCVNATSAGPVATVVLNKCNGPLGTQNISGTFAATFGQSNAGFTLGLKATNVNVGGRTGQFQVNGTASQTATGWTLAVTSNGSLTGLRGNSFNRNAQATINWVPGSGCVNVDSNGSFVVNGTTYQSSLSGYQRCTGACPAAGTLSVDGPDQDVSVTFDGTSTPTATSTNGNSADLQLACGG